MIERVAETIYQTLAFGNKLNEQPKEIKYLYTNIAKAAIEAMQNPTIEMISAGMDVEIDYFKAGGDIGERGRQIEASYKAMISKALKE